MAMRVNTNIAALNSLRQLEHTEKSLRTNLERLSSGRRLNRAADGPAAMVISEQMKAQIASTGQAINNSETSISMLQTVEGALNEASNILINLRQLAIHAANEGTNDEKMLLADQSEIDNLLNTLQQISDTTQFGTRFLLNGSNTTKGVAVGDGLEFISAQTETKSSPAEGYKIDITQIPTRAMVFAEAPLALEDVVEDQNFSIVLTESGKNAALDLNSNNKLRSQIDKILKDSGFGNSMNPVDAEMEDQAVRTIQHLVAFELQKKIDEAGLELDVVVYKPFDSFGEQLADWDQLEQRLEKIDNFPGELKDLVDEEVLVIRHRKFGSEPTFTVTTSMEGLFAFEEEVAANSAANALPGRDIEGTIGGHPELQVGEPALGNGQLLTGAPGTQAAGLTVKYKRDTDDVIHQVLQRHGITVDGVFVEENDDEALIGDDKPGAAAFGDQIAEIDGYVHLTQGALAFQVGPNQGQQVRISIADTRPSRLARGVENDSGFQNLNEITVLSGKEATDAIGMIDSAIDEVSFLRAKIGAFQKNALESNLNSLRIARENLMSSESQLADSDMAAEMSDFTRNQILLSTGTAMLAQANQIPKTVLQLLGNNQ
ncbi:MAG: flagellin [SAR324 cluster bacterium]|nr:flagellin [SAR324 cluster bacterium]